MWDPQWDAFQRTHRVVRCDLRGFGRSPLEPGAFTHAGDLIAVLEEHGFDRAALVGVSLGGRVALEVALARPELVSRLVLVAPGLPGHAWSDELKQDWEIEEAALVAGDLDPSQPASVAAGARVLDTWIPLDEERQRGLGHRGRDAGERRAQAGALDHAQLGAGAERHRVGVLDRHDPAHQPLAGGEDPLRERAPQRRARRLLPVDHRDQLEVARPERHDPVLGPDPEVAPAARDLQPVLVAQAPRGRLEVGGGDEDVVDVHRGIVLHAS
jgi:pimeloyl-ACP methyl ester carboxylesterase